MVNMKWCKKQSKGIRLTESNPRLAKSYLIMAEESIQESKNTKTNLWLASTTYYIYYYSLYALLQRIGITCEIHSCSIETMRKTLQEQYTDEENKEIEESFKMRNDLQYYADRNTPKEKIIEINIKAKRFYIKTKNIISVIKEEQINKIREKVKEL